MLDRSERPSPPAQRVIAASFERPDGANRAYLELKAIGIDPRRITVFASESTLAAGLGALAGAPTIADARGVAEGGVLLAVRSTERHLRSIRHVLAKHGGREEVHASAASTSG